MQQEQVAGPDLTRLWNAKETARYLGVTVSFLDHDRAREDRIPFVKLGGRIRYDPADVIAYLDRCKVRSEAGGRS